MNHIAFWTLPLSIPQGQVVVNESAFMTTLGRWKESINLMNKATVPFAFVFKYLSECIPPSIRNRFSKFVILDHVPNCEILNMYCLVIADKFSACLMEEISALIRNLFMLYRKSTNCFIPRIRAFLFARYRTLQSFKSFFRLAQKPRTINRYIIGGCNKRLDAKINTNFAPRVFGFRYINFTQDTGKVFTSCGAGNSDRFHCSFDLSMKDNVKSFAFGYIEFPIYNRPMLWDDKRLIGSFFLEVWELSSFIKEIVVSYIKVA